MISKYTYKGLTWVDIQSPSNEELASIAEEYNVPVIVAKEMSEVNSQSKVDIYSAFIYLILYFPQVLNKGTHAQEKEIDFILGDKFIITVHYEHIEALEEFSKNFEMEAVLEKRMDIDHAGFLFFHLIKTLYSSSRNQLQDVNILLKETENRIFVGQEGKMVAKLSNINRTLLDFRQALRFHKEVLNSFEFAAKQFFGDKFSSYLSAILSEYNKTQDMLDSHKEILDDLRDTNDSLLANKTNETMKILTIVTFLMSPVTVISSIFMMNTEFVLIQDKTEFYFVLGAMLISSILIFIYFKSKRWL